MPKRTALRQIVCLVVLALVAAWTPSSAQSSNETIWKQFLDWLPNAPMDGGPRILFQTYRGLLIKNGASPADADKTLDVVQRTFRERPDGWRFIFNNIYKSANPGHAADPNALLVSTVDGRKPGRALDIGMGQGRNTVFLALKGWDVTGFDMSDEGIAAARRNAERAGVKINAHRESEDSFNYGKEQWDLIVFMYEPFPITTSAYVDLSSQQNSAERSQRRTAMSN